MNKLKIVLGVLVVFVLLAAPAWFEKSGSDHSRGTLAAGGVSDGGAARGDRVVVTYAGGRLAT